MRPSDDLALRVAAIQTLGASLTRFTFTPADGGQLPTASAGAHLLLTIPGPHAAHRNAYSLVGNPEDRGHYDIIVRRLADGRGGSMLLHDTIRPGDVVRAAWPANLFPIPSLARRHLLFSGGIGITPLLSYLHVLRARGAAFELHHFCRAAERANFAALLAPPLAPLPDQAISIHDESRAVTFDADAVLSRQPLGTHLSVCGPSRLMDDLTARARRLGWPSASLHTESFGDHRGGAPFRVIAARSGLQLEVAGSQTILEALEAAGLAPPFLCRGGACGECLTRVLDGAPEHRDHFLDAAKRRAGDVMMICVSRACGATLTLDV